MSIFCRFLPVLLYVHNSSLMLVAFKQIFTTLCTSDFHESLKNRIKGSLDDNKEPLDENDDELFANAVQTVLNNNKN